MRPVRRATLLAVLSLLLAGCRSSAQDAPPAPATRPFDLGFTRWPADLTLGGVTMAQHFAHQHGDVVSVMFIGGIPWPEALAGKPFSKDVEDNFAYRPPDGKKLFLSISPLNDDRSGMAPYWGEKDNLPLPEPWSKLAFDSPEVEQAFLNFTLRAVKAMHPDYLAVGIELNVLLSKAPAKWPALKTLYRATYEAVKKQYPELPVFFTTEVLHYKKLASEAKGVDQEREVADLMRHSDVFAMSIYPHMSYDVPRPLPDDFLDFATRLGKPIAVSESGMTSRNVELKAFKLTLHGSEGEQRHFTDLLLRTAARDRYLFAITFATTDFEKLCAKLPAPVDDLARIWAYTGLQTSAGEAKPALAVWDAWLRARYER
ncbi:MAG: glycosyl hydrolase 53 family protein [Armatimonadetes bacterium]|nr:glycosyl hydrolase 53 family protein [Armatimonadota bacterium]